MKNIKKLKVLSSLFFFIVKKYHKLLKFDMNTLSKKNYIFRYKLKNFTEKSNLLQLKEEQKAKDRYFW